MERAGSGGYQELEITRRSPNGLMIVGVGNYGFQDGKSWRVWSQDGKSRTWVVLGSCGCLNYSGLCSGWQLELVSGWQERALVGHAMAGIAVISHWEDRMATGNCRSQDGRSW